MAGADASEALLYTPFVAALALFGLAVWLLYLKFDNPLNKGFALYLILYGMTRLLNGVSLFQAHGDLPGWLSRFASHYDMRALAPYYSMGAVFALGYLLAAYERSRGRFAWRRIGWAFLLGGLLVEAAYASDHCLHACPSADGRLAIGPLYLVSIALPFTSAVVALLMAHDAAEDLVEARRAAAFLVSVGLALSALVDATFNLMNLVVNGWGQVAQTFAPGPWRAAANLAYAAALAPVLACFAYYLEGARRQPRAVRKVRAAFLMAIPTVGTAAYAVFVSDPSDPGSAQAQLGVALMTAWRIALASLVCYALVRHRLFGVEVKLRWTIRRGTVAGVFLVAILTVGKLTESALTHRSGWVAGGLTAALLLFALKPLENLGQRLAGVLVPERKGGQRLSDRERRAVFLDQARMIWTDGAMGRRERALLENLRKTLGLETEEAARLERLAALPSPRRAKKGGPMARRPRLKVKAS